MVTRLKKLSLIIFLLVGTSLYAEINRYSVITLENLTPYKVSYIYGWGEGSQSGDGHNSIAPYGKYFYWWEFAYPGENWAPWFWLKLDSDQTWYKLGSFFSPNTGYDHAAHFYFVDYEYEDGSYEIKLIHEGDLEAYYWW